MNRNQSLEDPLKIPTPRPTRVRQTAEVLQKPRVLQRMIVNKKYKNILIGVTGSLAAANLSNLIEHVLKLSRTTGDLYVKVVVTANALRFFDQKRLPEKVEVLCDSDEWNVWQQPGDPIIHLEVNKWADVFLIAPLDANTLGKISNGICDNLLTSMARAWDPEKPLIFCPSMSPSMWKHPITAKQIAELKSFGFLEIPCVGAEIPEKSGDMAFLTKITGILDKLIFDMQVVTLAEQR